MDVDAEENYAAKNSMRRVFYVVSQEEQWHKLLQTELLHEPQKFKSQKTCFVVTEKLASPIKRE
jgi:hypothetical protein